MEDNPNIVFTPTTKIKMYGMLGRVLEKSIEDLHALIAQIKKMVRTMYGDVKRIGSAKAKDHNCLKRDVIDGENTINASIKRHK